MKHSIIQVIEENNDLWIDARELWEKLEVKRDFPTWIKDRIEKWGFKEHEDYSPELGNRSDGLPGKPRKEYKLSARMGVHIAVSENSPIGMKIRDELMEFLRDHAKKIKNYAEQVRLNRDYSANRYTLIDSREASKMLGISISRVQELSKERKIPHVSIISRYRYRRSDIMDMIDNNYVPVEQAELPFDDGDIGELVVYPVKK